MVVRGLIECVAITEMQGNGGEGSEIVLLGGISVLVLVVERGGG